MIAKPCLCPKCKPGHIAPKTLRMSSADSIRGSRRASRASELQAHRRDLGRTVRHRKNGSNPADERKYGVDSYAPGSVQGTKQVVHDLLIVVRLLSDAGLGSRIRAAINCHTDLRSIRGRGASLPSRMASTSRASPTCRTASSPQLCIAAKIVPDLGAGSGCSRTRVANSQNGFPIRNRLSVEALREARTRAVEYNGSRPSIGRSARNSTRTALSLLLYYRGKPLPYRAVPIRSIWLPCSEEAYLLHEWHRMESLLGDRALYVDLDVARPTAKAKMLGLCGSGDPLVVTHQHRIRRRVLDPEDAITRPSRRRFRR